MTQVLTMFTPASLDFAIAAWIHEKFGHTKSEKTKSAYSETILAFRQVLQDEVTAGRGNTMPLKEILDQPDNPFAIYLQLPFI